MNFHVDFDGLVWRCYETVEMTREDSPIAPLSNPVFAADWDGVSSNLSNVRGVKPSNIPFMGWPQA